MITHLLWLYDCACDETGKFLFDKAFLNQAKDIASTLPAMCDSRELMLISDKDNYYQNKKITLEEIIFILHSEIEGYCFNYSAEEKIKEYEALQALLELIYTDGSYDKNSFNRLYNCGHLGHLYHKVGNDEKSIEYLKKAAEYAVTLDSSPNETERIKRFYNCGTAHREMSACEFMKTVITEHYSFDKEFKRSVEFKEIIKMLE